MQPVHVDMVVTAGKHQRPKLKDHDIHPKFLFVFVNLGRLMSLIKDNPQLTEAGWMETLLGQCVVAVMS